MEYKKQREFLKKQFENGNLGHAYLLSGPNPAEIKNFAKEFIQFINGNVASHDNAIEKEQFPDLLVITSARSESSQKNEKDMMEIDVDQIRQANTFLSYKSYYGNYKAVIIEHAERMNIEAQNCFLKTLEEPKGAAIIFLISSRPDALLPTIFSRCQTIKFLPTGKLKAPAEEQKMLQELLPLLRAELATKFNYTKKVNLEGENLEKILGILQRYFRNMLLIKLGVVKESVPAEFADYPIEKLQKIIALIESLHQKISTTNANPKLALEILLMEM